MRQIAASRSLQSLSNNLREGRAWKARLHNLQSPISNLPLRRARRAFLQFLPLALLALLVVWPSIRYGPPDGNDAPPHLFRLVELDWHFRHGDFYPRWFSDLHYGYGSPLPNFYAPLANYVGLAIHLLGVSFAGSLHAGLILSVALAILGAYFWGRDQFESAPAGLAAAVAYGMSPYTYANLLGRAGLPEMWALAVAPWLFWAIWRWFNRPSRGARVALAVLFAGLLLTHSISALLFTALAALYSLFVWVEQSTASLSSRPSRLRGSDYLSAAGSLLSFGLSLAHGAGLAAFFLAPFLLEAQYVQLGRAALPAIFDYRNNFLEWRTLFAPPAHFDPYHVINVQPTSLAWPPVVMGVVGLALAIIAWRRRARGFPLLVAVIALAFAFVTTLMSRSGLPLWSAIPFMSLFQFQWRFMGAATFLLAWLAASGVPGGRWQLPIAIVFIAGNFFFTLPWTYHEPFKPYRQDYTPADAIRWEIDNAPIGVGTTYSQEFLPRWVEELPSPDATLPRYSEADIPSRLAATPPGVTLISEDDGVKSTEFVYDAGEAFAAGFNIFYFPGWAARLDGKAIPVEVTSPQGTLAVDLPAGRHTFQLALLPTAPQIAGTLISLVALIVLAFQVAPGAKRVAPPEVAPGAKRVAPPEIAPGGRSYGHSKADLGPGDSPQKLPNHWTWLFVGLLILRVAVLDRIETPFYYTELDDIPNRTSANFSDQLLLIGYKFPRGDKLVSGDTFQLVLYWQAAQPMSVNYHTAVQLVDAQGNRFGQSDNEHPALMPTANWKPGQYAIDLHRLRSFTGVPPGEYHLRVSAYRLTEGGIAPLNVLADGTPAGTEYDLGTVTVTRGRPGTPGPLRLVEASLAVETAGVGDAVPFTVLWNSGDEALPPLAARFTLIGVDDQILFSTDFPPAGPAYPTNQWTRDELVRWPHSVTLPVDLPPGVARISLALVNGEGAVVAGPYPLGQIRVTVPERTFDAPPMGRRLDYDFEGTIRLLGYDVTAESITLYWQALRPVTPRLTTFIHVFDASGAFVAGHDSPPIRATTSWLPGEVIADTHPIGVGERFEVGLYDSLMGERYGEPVEVSDQ